LSIAVSIHPTSPKKNHSAKIPSEFWSPGIHFGWFPLIPLLRREATFG